MSESEDGDGFDEGVPGRQEIIPPARDQTPPELLSRLLDLERERIASADKRTDAMRFAIEANITSDNRQFDFHMERLRVSEARMGRKDSFARVVVLTALAITTVLGAFLLWLAFYGDAHQSEVALKIVYMGLTALGGYGIFSTIRRISKHLFKNDDDDDA